jgi:hypothetical protein
MYFWQNSASLSKPAACSIHVRPCQSSHFSFPLQLTADTTLMLMPWRSNRWLVHFFDLFQILAAVLMEGWAIFKHDFETVKAVVSSIYRGSMCWNVTFHLLSLKSS